MMKKNETGRSMIEMIMVLALMGILTIGSIGAYQTGQNKAEVNKIAELVSIASLNGVTKMKEFGNGQVWKSIGKNQADYKCISSLIAKANGQVEIHFNNDCEKVKKELTSQWGSLWNEGTSTYTPPRDEEGEF